jgi:exodeoxyribonuclease VII small subunit
MAEKEATFESSLARLEEIVAALEKGEAPLEGSIELFEEGIALSRRCHEMLSTAEGRVRRLVKERGGDFTLELFPEEGEEP